MNINKLTLSTPDLLAQHDFYQHVLKLPVTITSDEQLVVQVGTTKLTFVQAPVAGAYHFAFNIPENQLAAARNWLSAPLIKANDGRDEFFIESWNAHTIYFYDPAGNILELIARHTLDNASSEPFSEKSLLNISEIGIAVENVPTFIENSGLPPYGIPGDMFAPLGDENGLLIVVKVGREWFPDTRKPALELPLHAVIASQGTIGEITGTPNATLQRLQRLSE